jgi:glycosyltransferase involved in cell wall biosynthesis
VVVGRLAGDTDVPDNAVSFYGLLAEALPGVELWFMPAPEPLRAAYRNDPRFRFLDRNEIPVPDFLSACHIFALTYSGVPVPGPRSLMEAMAAGCAPVTIDRGGPRDRIVQGESGFRTNDDDEMIDHIMQLATDTPLRERISHGAARRASEFDPDNWVRAIVRTSLHGDPAAGPG